MLRERYGWVFGLSETSRCCVCKPQGTLGFVEAIWYPSSVTSHQPSYGEGEGSILQTADQKGRGPMVLTHLIGCGCYFGVTHL